MTCQTCNNWKPKNTGQMARHGFAICGLQKRYTFFAPHHTCERHKQATKEVVDARAKWLNQ